MKGGGTPLFSFIGLAIGIIHAFLPMGDFNEYVCKVINLINIIDN